MKETKFLGIWIDKKLNWHKQVSTLLLKLKRNMYLLCMCKNFLDKRSRVMIYNTHIQSHVIYCLSTWGNMNSNQQKISLNNLMQKCINLIDRTAGANINVHNINELILLENYKFGYKLVHSQLPTNILKCAMTDQNGQNLMKTHKYSMRSKSIANLPRASSSKYSNSIFCCSLHDYSKLALDTRLCKSYQFFVSKCKQNICQTRSKN